MNPDPRRQPLAVERVEWIPSSPDEIEVRVYGTWRGATVPPAVSLVVGGVSVDPLPDPPAPGLPPAWTAAFLVPGDARAVLEAGEARLAGPGVAVSLPPAEPGAMDGPAGTLVDPAVLAERRARRAELAEESAARRAASAEETVQTLRAQLEHLEERAARATAERDRLAARVGDAERHLRLTAQREEAERRRRAELEEELAEARREAETQLEDLRARLAGAQEIAAALERELKTARRRAETAEADRAARRAAEQAATRATAEAESLRAEAEFLRGRAAESDALRAEADSLRARAAEADALRAEADSLRARAADADALRAEADSLRARAAAADALRAEVEALREPAALADRLQAEAHDLRAEAEALRAEARRLPEPTADPAEIARLRAQVESLEQRLATRASPSDREQALANQVASLEAELARRVGVQERVQEAIALIRSELRQVRAQAARAEPGRAAESAAIAELRAELVELEERGRALEATVRARDVDLEAARRELDRALGEAFAARADAERAEQVAAQLRERLVAEQAARARAEERLAEQWPPPTTEPPATGDPALDTLITGLRAQVAAAREQLARWGAGESEPRAPHESPEPQHGATNPDDPAAGPWEEPAADPSGEAPPHPLRAVDPDDPERPAAAPGAAQEPARPAAPESPAELRRPTAADEDATRRRLRAIADELRAAVPDDPSPRASTDVVADLQRAAERLRAAAEQELERLERPGDAPVAPREGTAPAPTGEPQPGEGDTGAGGGAAPEPTASAHPLSPRRVAPTTREAAWLRTGLERLANREPDTAAQLFAALLPVQALLDQELTYAVAAPGVGSLRVVLSGGTARVEPRDRPGDPDEVDVVVEGPLDALAPLAAGGAGWRLKGARVSGSRWRLRRLLRARRGPVRLVDLGRAGSPVHPGLLLAALAAAVDPPRTRGHRFAVTYAIAGDGTFTVVASDGAPLAVHPGEQTPDARIDVTAPAFMPLLAGHTPPPTTEHPTVTGDTRAVDSLHAWFDAARGVTAG